MGEIIIVIRKPFSDEVFFAATRRQKTWASGDVEITVYTSEEDFRRAHPEAPREWENGSMYWSVPTEEVE